MLADRTTELAILAALVVVPPVTSLLVIVLHEAAHAVVARMLGLDVHAVEIGAGRALRAFWIGDVLVTLRLWPLHGLVVLAHRSARWFRTRQILVCLAGPLVNWAVFALFVAAWIVIPEQAWRVDWEWWVPFLLVGTVTAAFFAVLSLVPKHVRFADAVHPSDMWHVLRMLRPTTDAEIDAVVSQCSVLREHYALWREFLRGRVQAALERARRRREGSPDDWGAGVGESIAVMVLDGADAALAVHAEAEARFETWRQRTRGAARVAEDHRQVLAINRAFFLAHTGRSEDLEEADSMLAEVCAEGGGPGALRTRGLVLLRRHQVADGMELLRRAWHLEEPIWLRALCAAYLALGHAMCGERNQARRWLRRARRLHRSSPLLPIYEGFVERALARGPVRGDA